MMRRGMALLLTAGLLMTMLPMGALAEEDMELTFSPNEMVQEKGEQDESEKSELDKIKDTAASLITGLGRKDWEALAKQVRLTGDWREDMVNVAQSQLGYQEEKDGMTLYTRWAGLEKEKEDQDIEWTALFIGWVADRIGLSSKEFPQSETYKNLCSRMKNIGALKKISRAAYPVIGDLALIEIDGRKLVGVVIYVSNDYASVVHGDDNGRVTKETYKVGGPVFKQYIDLNVLMERAGVEVGKGGAVPVIPEGGVAAWTNTNAVYLRKEPTTASKSLTTIKKAKTAVLVTSAEMQEDGYIWYGVQYKKHEGFIRGDLLNLDRSALPAVTPMPEKTPEPTPVPGCTYCNGASLGLALPVECCYEHLTSMSVEDASTFMKALLKDDPSAFAQYLSCTAAHVKAGAAEILCLGKECGAAAWGRPGPLHSESCPWHREGLAAQERVINLEIREARKGQELLITFDVYGASAYKWHEVKSVVNADGTVAVTDSVLTGENAASIVVTAKNEVNTTYSYYCMATIIAGENVIEIASKETALSVASAPVVAQAILGEEVNFTYTNSRAVKYQWYVQADENSTAAAISAENTAYAGADTSKLTFYATAENSGALYSCAALDMNGREISRSGFYAYAINLYTEAPDATVCEGHDLCKYVEELAQMTLEERCTALNFTWYVSTADVTADASAADCLAEHVMLHWFLCHQGTYPNLICTCAPTAEDRLVLHPYDELHEAECPWYAAPVKAASGENESVQRADQEEFDKWAATATADMIKRARTVPTLDHAVFEQKEDGTRDVYIARYAEPVGLVDAQGYLTYGDPSLVIAWVDFSTGTVYAMNNLPSHAPACAN